MYKNKSTYFFLTVSLYLCVVYTSIVIKYLFRNKDYNAACVYHVVLIKYGSPGLDLAPKYLNAITTKLILL